MGIRPFDMGDTMASTIFGVLLLWALASVLFLAIAYGVSAKRRVCTERRIERILSATLLPDEATGPITLEWRHAVVAEAKRITRTLAARGRADTWALCLIEARSAVLMSALGFDELHDPKTTRTIMNSVQLADLVLGRSEIYRLTAHAVVTDRTPLTARQVASKAIRGA